MGKSYCTHGRGARCCGYCGGCPHEVGALTRYLCPVIVTYANGGTAPVCMDERICAKCLPKVKADPHDDCLKWEIQRLSEPVDATSDWARRNPGHHIVKVSRGREVYRRKQEVA